MGDVLVERHVGGMKKGQRADLAVIPPGSDRAVLFEFKVAWCESRKKIQEAVDGVKSDLDSRKRFTTYSVVLGFKFDWPGQLAPKNFRWQPTRRDPASFGDVVAQLDKNLIQLGLTRVGERNAVVDEEPSTSLYLSLWQHP